MSPHGSKTKRSIRNAERALRTLLGLFLALLLAAPVHAGIIVNADVEVTINLQFPSELTLPPSGPWFTGSSFFTAGILNGTQFVPMSTFGPAQYNVDVANPNPVQSFEYTAFSTDQIVVWNFGGTVDTTAGSFPALAWPSGSTIPDSPPSRAAITVTSYPTPGFAPYEVKGPIVAWEEPVQIGTYDIRVSPAPEPGSLLLTGLGLVALITLSSAKAIRRAQS